MANLKQRIPRRDPLGNSPNLTEIRCSTSERLVNQNVPLASPPRTGIGYPGLQFPKRNFLGVNISVCRRAEIIALLLNRLARRQLTKVAFANVHLLSQLSNLDSKISLDDFVVLNDGIGLDIGSWALYGSRFPENMNGTDLVPALLRAADKDTRVFLYGARPQIAERAGMAIADLCGVTICGACDGYGVAIEADAVADRIRKTSPDIVLVALGNPKQEIWIEANAAMLHAPIVIGVGALFDFLGGAYPRAPRWIRRARLEWMHRLALEPGRLWRRYTIDTFRLFVRLLLFRSQHNKRSAPGLGAARIS